MMNISPDRISPLSNANESSYPPTKAIKHIRRGSLPFKKRRFSHLCSPQEKKDDLSLTSLVDMVGQGNGKSQGISESFRGINVSQSHEQNDEAIAALALVAAAASASEVTPSSEASQESKENSVSFPSQEGTFSTGTTALSSDLAAAAADLKYLHDASPNSSSDSSRTMLQPLSSTPLPNGCHGRTSRNNSYCRRQPCYQGSKYCKLHYQQYVVSGGGHERDVNDLVSGEDETPRGVKPNAQAATVEDGETPSASQNTPADVGKGTHGSQHHQDKRYTGSANESRCQATTTRGRECAYCAVGDTKYCHLHADYDTNPPPRRGGASSSNNSGAKAKKSATTERASMASGPLSVSSEETSVSGKSKKTDETKRKSSGTSARRASTCKNMEKHMADAPFPLLSVLSTDQWFNRKVIVATGPLSNHIGLVEKWGNGWVSVRLPGVGLHNRRSFELYLHPDQESDSLAGPTTSETQMKSPEVEIFDTPRDLSESQQDLMRCISRDADTPPSSVVSGKSTASPGSDVHEVTPLTSCRIIGIDRNKAQKASGHIMFPRINSPNPQAVPESPLQIQRSFKDDKTDTAKCIDQRVAADSSSQKDSKTSHSNFQLSVKSRSPSGEDEMPLFHLLSQEGRSRNGKLGLLFGTAALERSRRSVHRPTWYEPESKAAKKRGRDETDLSNGLDGANKVKLTEDAFIRQASVPLISSSSDEESTGLPAGAVSV